MAWKWICSKTERQLLQTDVELAESGATELILRHGFPVFTCCAFFAAVKTVRCRRKGTTNHLALIMAPNLSA